jgi:ABC-type iron transport system FetAB permease component
MKIARTFWYKKVKASLMLCARSGSQVKKAINWQASAHVIRLIAVKFFQRSVYNHNRRERKLYIDAAMITNDSIEVSKTTRSPEQM